MGNTPSDPRQQTDNSDSEPKSKSCTQTFKNRKEDSNIPQ